MSQYQLTASGIIRTSDGASIPADPNNSDYAEFLAWEQDGNVPDPLPVETLDQAKQIQITALMKSYANAITQPVLYTTKAGVAKKFNADPQSVSNLQSSLLGCMASQATPPNFFWVTSENTAVPFAYADLQGLASVIFAQGATAFANLQAKELAVSNATTVSAVQAITF